MQEMGKDYKAIDEALLKDFVEHSNVSEPNSQAMWAGRIHPGMMTDAVKIYCGYTLPSETEATQAYSCSLQAPKDSQFWQVFVSKGKMVKVVLPEDTPIGAGRVDQP